MPWLICSPFQVGISFLLVFWYLGSAIIPAIVAGIVNIIFFKKLSRKIKKY